MSRLECETAAQCQRIAEAQQELVLPIVTALLVVFVLIALYNVSRWGPTFD